MGRIIRVDSCDDCPYSRYHFNKYFYCAKNPARKVDNYMDNKTLPDNCPLEKEREVTMTDVHGAFGGTS